MAKDAKGHGSDARGAAPDSNMAKDAKGHGIEAGAHASGVLALGHYSDNPRLSIASDPSYGDPRDSKRGKS